MKAFHELKRIEIPVFKSESLIRRLHSSAKEHGYRSILLFGIIRYKDYILGRIAKISSWNGFRVSLQRLRGVYIGKNVHIGPDVIIDNLYPNLAIIEDNSGLAGNDYILTHTKPGVYHCRVIESYAAPVIIRKNVWIALNVTILPGVEIGEGAIVSAGSVVYKDVPAMTIVSGNPAKVIADLSRLLKKNYSKEDFDKIINNRNEKFRI